MSVPNPATTEWVPLWDLEGGVNLNYKGSWAAGSYVDGDVVVHQGTTYMCVRPTSAAPVPWPLASGAASYGTEPPANPVDGQIWIRPTNSGEILWQFRYNASISDAYKWQFLGGNELVSHNQPDEAMVADTSWHNFSPGISVVLSRAGIYDLVGSARVYTAGAAVRASIGFGYGAAAPGAYAADAFAADARTITGYSIRQTFATAGTVVTLQYQFTATPSSPFGARKNLMVTPVRVS